MPGGARRSSEFRYGDAQNVIFDEGFRISIRPCYEYCRCQKASGLGLLGLHAKCLAIVGPACLDRLGAIREATLYSFEPRESHDRNRRCNIRRKLASKFRASYPMFPMEIRR